MFLIFAGLSAAQFHAYLFESKGIQGLQIGILIMAGQGTAILSPLFQVSIIRRFGGPQVPLMLMLAGTAISMVLLPYMHSFMGFLFLFPIFSFCGASVFPLNAACTFEAMRNQGYGQFFRIRSLGTLGFLVGCLISVFFPTLLELPLLYKGFSAALIMALGVVFWDHRRGRLEKLSQAILEEIKAHTPPRFFEALRRLREPQTLRLLVVLGLMNFANSMAIGVQGNYLMHKWHEGQRTISLAWVVSTACEVPLMLLCGGVLKKYGLGYVLGLGIFGTLFKLAGLAVAGTLWQFYLALTMHGCFYSGALTGFGIYIDRKYRREESPTLQTLSGVFYGGIPSALAGLGVGWLWHLFSLQAVYWVSGAIAVPTAIYAFFLLNQSGKNGDKNVF
jgi:MFS transporter, PPP family, 3-phenylpropionic acid transporter